MDFFFILGPFSLYSRLRAFVRFQHCSRAKVSSLIALLKLRPSSFDPIGGWQSSSKKNGPKDRKIDPFALDCSEALFLFTIVASRTLWVIVMPQSFCVVVSTICLTFAGVSVVGFGSIALLFSSSWSPSNWAHLPWSWNWYPSKIQPYDCDKLIMWKAYTFSSQR